MAKITGACHSYILFSLPYTLGICTPAGRLEGPFATAPDFATHKTFILPHFNHFIDTTQTTPFPIFTIGILDVLLGRIVILYFSYHALTC